VTKSISIPLFVGFCAQEIAQMVSSQCRESIRRIGELNFPNKMSDIIEASNRNAERFYTFPAAPKPIIPKPVLDTKNRFDCLTEKREGCIWCSGVPQWACNELVLRKHFSCFGKISDLSFDDKEMTCYVVYDNYDEAKMAVDRGLQLFAGMPRIKDIILIEENEKKPVWKSLNIVPTLERVGFPPLRH
jgi:hypothetical protein